MEGPRDRPASAKDSKHGFSGRPAYDVDSPVSPVSPISSPQHTAPTSPAADRDTTQSMDGNRTETMHSARPASTKAHRTSTATTRDRARSSIDQSVRPSSKHTAKTDAPWIGTFNFEKEEGDATPPVPTDRSPDAHGSSDASSNDADLEKQEAKKREEQDAAAAQQQEDPNLVDFTGPDDPANPQNWGRGRRWFYTLCLGLTTFAVTFASSVFSTATVPTSEQFGVSQEVMVLGVALFVLGFAWGPTIWGPLSELYGRKPPLYFGYFVFAVFQIATAVAQNLYTIFLCRFFGGFFGSAPLAVIGGALADMWGPVDRGYALCVFAGATFIGPAVAPVVGGFVVQQGPTLAGTESWRWTEYLTAILAFALGITSFFIVPETFAQRLLHDKAQRIRFETKNWAVHSKQDEQRLTVGNIAEKYLLRPATMLVLEPILVLITVYMSLIYGILYLFFEAFPIAFQEERGWSPGVGSLPFLALLLGVLLGAGIISYFTKYRFARRLREEGKVVPEERLVPMFVGGVLMPAGLFWFAWTSDASINPWPQIISIIPVGAGILIIFMQGLNYLIDVYLMYANSAIAANTFARSWVGAGFPMFATGMYHNLGVPWATSLLGFLCIALYPFPILFYIYGSKIRGWSRYSPT